MSSRNIEVTYYAVLRDQRGRASEQLQTEATTLAALYEQLRATHGFSLSAESLGVAVNDTMCPWDRAPAEGDRVAFLPPVAGG